MDFFRKKVFTAYSAMILAIVVGLAAMTISLHVPALKRASAPPAAELGVNELYKRAVVDAMTIEPEEIMPLIDIAPESSMCTWDDEGRFLLLSWHRYPDSYKPGEDFTLEYGEVWTFTDREIIKWYDENKDGVDDWDMRLRQLIGLPPDKSYTHVSAMWARPDDVIRPAYAWTLADAAGADGFAEKPDEEYKKWFDSNIIWSYFDSAYPWTRLGYTYDWADNGREYGLSEFIIKKGSTVKVEFTLSTEEFIDWLEKMN